VHQAVVERSTTTDSPTPWRTTSSRGRRRDRRRNLAGCCLTNPPRQSRRRRRTARPRRLRLLEEKLHVRKQTRVLESQRNRKRRALFEARDDIDGKRDRLIGEMAGKLEQGVFLRLHPDRGRAIFLPTSQ